MTPALPLIKALVEPVRIRLYLLLKQSPLTVSEISHILGISQSNTSHHVKGLREVGLLTAEKTGQHTYYALTNLSEHEPNIAALLKNLEQLRDEIPETRNDAAKLRTVLSRRNEETFALWRMEQPDLPYSDIFAHLASGRAGTVADIACGEGDFFESLSLSFDHVIAIDLEEAHCLRAKERARNFAHISVLSANAQEIPLSDACVDSVVLRMALSQVTEPAQACAEAMRILKAGGFISIIDGEKASGDTFRRQILEQLAGSGNFHVDVERTLPRLFMLRAQKSAGA
jgi:DNA-binding transcriptional ArsR family regulator